MTHALILHHKKHLFTCTVCDTSFAQFRGFMFSAKPEPHHGLLFPLHASSSTSFHNLFVFFSIDFLVLTHTGAVAAIKRNIQPFTLHIMSVPAHHTVIELPAGSADSLAVGDTLTIKLKNN